VLAPRARLVALLAALLLAAGAVQVAARDVLPAPAWLSTWTARHPDPRTFSEAESLALRALQDKARRKDVMLLFAALAAGCAAVAAFPRLPARAGGVRVAVLAAGTVTLGIALAASSVVGQARLAAAREWSLGDDALGALAGPHTATLRAWRARVPESDAVLLLGTDSSLWNVTAWALHPRAIFPLLRDVPPDMSDEAQDFGRGQGARWVVDLGALAAPARSAHAALLKVDP